MVRGLTWDLFVCYTYHHEYGFEVIYSLPLDLGEVTHVLFNPMSISGE